jgi:hypothetical protein
MRSETVRAGTRGSACHDAAELDMMIVNKLQSNQM